MHCTVLKNKRGKKKILVVSLTVERFYVFGEKKWNISLFTNLPTCTYLWEKYYFVQVRAQAHPPVRLTCSFTLLRLSVLPQKDHLGGRRVSGIKLKAGGFSELIAYEFIDFTLLSNVFQMIVCFHMSTPAHTCEQLRCPKIVSFRKERMA